MGRGRLCTVRLPAKVESVPLAWCSSVHGCLASLAAPSAACRAPPEITRQILAQPVDLAEPIHRVAAFSLLMSATMRLSRLETALKLCHTAPSARAGEFLGPVAVGDQHSRIFCSTTRSASRHGSYSVRHR